MKTFAVVAVAGFAIFLLTAVYLLRGGYRTDVSPSLVSTDPPLSTRNATSEHFGDAKARTKLATSPMEAQRVGKAAGARDNEPGSAAAESTEQQKKLREYLDAQYRRIYEDVGAALGLNADETDTLLKLLVDQQMLMSKAFDGGSEAEQAARFTAWQQGRREAVAAQLGGSRAAAFTNYEQSITARYEVDAIRYELERAQVPLTELQRKSLIASAIERKAFFPMPEFPGNAATAEIQKLMAQIEVRDQRMLPVARGILTSAQYTHYQQFQANRHDLMEASLRTAPEGK